MTTSDYLKIQAQVLMAFDCLKGQRLEEFIRESKTFERTGDAVVDHYGLIAQADPARLRRLADAALIFRNSAEALPIRKPITLETFHYPTQEKQTA